MKLITIIIATLLSVGCATGPTQEDLNRIKSEIDRADHLLEVCIGTTVKEYAKTKSTNSEVAQVTVTNCRYEFEQLCKWSVEKGRVQLSNPNYHARFVNEVTPKCMNDRQEAIERILLKQLVEAGR